MARKKPTPKPTKEAGRPPLTARAGRALGRGLHALRPAWVLAVGGVAYLGLVFMLESAAAAHGANRIQKLEIDVEAPPVTHLAGASAGASSDTTAAAADLIQFGRQTTDRRLTQRLNQSLQKNPRQDALLADVLAAVKADAGLKSVDAVQPLFPGKLRVVVTTRVPECRLTAGGRAVDADGVLLPIDMGHCVLPEYSREGDPTARVLNGRLVDPLFAPSVQALRTVLAALPDLATNAELAPQTLHVTDAGRPAELTITLRNGARLEWGRLNEIGDYAAQLDQRKKALLAVQARYADLNNLLVVRLYDTDAPVELRQPQPVEFHPAGASHANPLSLNATRTPAH